jgi:hypothetical protein
MIKKLIDAGVITEQDVLDYARSIDQNYDDEEIYYDGYFDFPPDREYIIASTSYRMNETYIFPANENGEIESFSEIGGIAERHGDVDWENHKLAVDTVMGESKYEFVAQTHDEGEVIHNLYKRVGEQ